MPEIMNPDGSWTALSEAEFIERFGEDDLRALKTPIADLPDMTEGERYLADKMQSEHDTSAALAAAGYDSVFDLPMESDDDSISLDDLVPQEYDDEGALRDLRERESREARDSGV